MSYNKLSEFIKDDCHQDLDLNCAETILYGANEVYNLGLDKNALKLAAGFGGGMGIESVCGALTGAIMVLGNLFVINNAHESSKIKKLDKKLFNLYMNKTGEIHCKPLKDKYYNEDKKCKETIVKAAEVLDEIIAKEIN